MSEKLIASACSKCYFYEDCMYKNRPEKLVEDIRDRDVRRKYVEQIGGPEVQPHEFVSCESAVRKATTKNTVPEELTD